MSVLQWITENLNDLDNFFITVKKNDTPWFVFMDMSFEKTFSQQREQLCTGQQKARERGGEHHGKDSGEWAWCYAAYLGINHEAGPG